MTPRRAVALQQSWMEKAETFRTVTACHRRRREDTKSSLPDGVKNTRSRIGCLYFDEEPAYHVPFTGCGNVVRQCETKKTLQSESANYRQIELCFG